MQSPFTRSNQVGGVAGTYLPLKASVKFQKKDRLLKRASFTAVLDGGEKAVSRLLVVLARKGTNPEPQLGIIVSKKVGNAVARNRIKRIIRETFRHHKGEWPTGVAIVVIARHSARLAQGEDIKRAFTQCMERLGKKLIKEFT